MDEKKIEMTEAQLKELVADVTSKALEEALETKGVNAAMKKFENTALKGMEGLDGKQKTAKFIQAVFNRDTVALTALKAMTEGTGSAGGFLVPEEFTADVFRLVEDFGLVAKLATRIPMGSDTMNLPVLSTSVSVTYPGEATAGTPSAAVLAQVQLLAKTIMGLTALSNELIADANVQVVELLTTLFAEAIAGEIDDQGLTGTGSPFTGILGNASVNIVTLSTEETFTLASTPDNMRSLITNVKPWALQGSAFIMHRTIWALLQIAKSSSGGDYFASAVNPIVSGNAASGFPNAVAGTLWGYPVYLSDKMPALSETAVSTKFVIFGNLKHLFYGVRNEMTMTISQDATVGSDNLFEKNMSAVRVTSRHALAVGLPAAFAVLKTSAS